MHLDITNVEELIFYNPNIFKYLPDYSNYLNQWKLAKMAHLKSLEKQTLLDFLNNLTDQALIILEEYFGCKINLTKIDYSLVSNFSCKITNSIDDLLKNVVNFVDFTIYRNQDNLYISFLK
jgi:hypothetical protein